MNKIFICFTFIAAITIVSSSSFAEAPTFGCTKEDFGGIGQYCFANIDSAPCKKQACFKAIGAECFSFYPTNAPNQYICFLDNKSCNDFRDNIIVYMYDNYRNISSKDEPLKCEYVRRNNIKGQIDFSL